VGGFDSRLPTRMKTSERGTVLAEGGISQSE
jgi:hypothetical protein